MKKISKILAGSFFIYLLMFQGQYTGSSTNSLDQCQSWARSGGYGYYCIWN